MASEGSRADTTSHNESNERGGRVGCETMSKDHGNESNKSENDFAKVIVSVFLFMQRD